MDFGQSLANNARQGGKPRTWDGVYQWQGGAGSLTTPLTGQQQQQQQQQQQGRGHRERAASALRRLFSGDSVSLPKPDGSEPAWRSVQTEGSLEYQHPSGEGGPHFPAAGSPGVWNRATATNYCFRMLWEQSRAVLPIAAFLLGYQWLILQVDFFETSATVGHLIGMLFGIISVIIGLTIFMVGPSPPNSCVSGRALTVVLTPTGGGYRRA
jgi:hypothetical protein